MNRQDKIQYLISLKRADGPNDTIHASQGTRYFNEGLSQEIQKLTMWSEDLNTEQPPAEKPPLGLMPQHHHKQLRLIEITRAVGRYIGAWKAIPDEWLEEMLDLQRWLQFHRDNHLLETNLPTL